MDLRAHVKLVHERLGRDTGIPVFPPNPKTPFTKDTIPPNYVPIAAPAAEPGHKSAKEGQQEEDYPVYEKPRPVLRMITPPLPPAAQEEDSVKMTLMMTRSSSSKKDNTLDEEAEKKRLKEIEDQREIEEWMISQGVSIGLIEQNSATVLRIPVLPTGANAANAPNAPGGGEVAGNNTEFADPGVPGTADPSAPLPPGSSSTDSSAASVGSSMTTAVLPPLPDISSLVGRKDKRKGNIS